MVSVYIILSLIGIFFYLRGKAEYLLISILLIGTNCFMFLPEGSYILSNDCILAIVVVISIIEFLKNKSFFSIEDDPIGKCVLVILIYSTAIGVASILFRKELPVYAFKVVRWYWVFLFYFYLRNQELKKFGVFFKVVLVFCFVQGFCYYLQFLGIELLQGAGGDMTRLGNYPKFTKFFLLYYLINRKFRVETKLFFLLFFGGMIVLSMNRGPILCLGAGLVYYLFAKRSANNIKYVIVGALLFIFVVKPIFETRGDDFGQSATEEISSLVKNSGNLSNMYSPIGTQGTMTYRFLVLAERIDFLLSNPQYLPFGIGCIHENSPMNSFDVFIMGVPNEGLVYGKETISSNDVTWVNIVMRFGLIGFAMFLWLFIKVCKISYPLIAKSTNMLFITSSMVLFGEIFESFATNLLNTPFRVIIEVLIFISIISRYTKECNNKITNKEVV